MSANKRYLEMFQSPAINSDPVLMDFVKNEIADLRARFKKSDRITWLLRVLKYQMYSDDQDVLTRKEKAWCINFERKMIIHDEFSLSDLEDGVERDLFGMEDGRYNDIKISLAHFIDLDIPEINNIDFGQKNVTDLRIQMDGHEIEWLERSHPRSIPSYGVSVIQFDDGSAIYDLEKRGCEIEGKAMGFY